LLVKQWNWEVDVTKNQKWHHVGVDHTEFGQLDEDTKDQLTKARFRLTNATLLDSYMADEQVDLSFELANTGEPLHGSCWETATETIKRASKGWFGIYKVWNLWLQNGDEETATGDLTGIVEGNKGGMTLDWAILMWYLMRELEQLYAAILVRAGPEVIIPLERDARKRFKEVYEKIPTIGQRDIEDKLKKIVDSWYSTSLTMRDADLAIIAQMSPELHF